MAAANAPTVTSLGIAPQFVTFTYVTLESDKYICVRETSPQNSVVIINMAVPALPLRRPITADSALMNPNTRILALKDKEQTTKMELQANSKPMKGMHKGAMKTDLHEDDGQVVDESTKALLDPWNPYFPSWPDIPPNLDLAGAVSFIDDWKLKRVAYLASYRSTCVIMPDRTPPEKNANFYVKTYRLMEPILEKDSRCRFLRLFDKRMDRLISGFIITPETLNCIIIKNAMRCAKLVLEGQHPVIGGFRANPNCMNRYGYFPLHEAAESFSVDMIKLLICHGASANLRTSGNHVKEGLLPLHVAVENTCLHKYLEENLFPNQEHPDYSEEDIYKAIHLLCLPEMKIFLDTTRELAKHTNNLVDEVWNYMKDGKLIHAAVLLLAAQDHIRPGSSCSKNGGNKLDGFATIFTRIHNSMTLEWQMHQNGRIQQLPQSKIKLLLSTSLLVNIICRAGEALDAYIQEHSEVPHKEVLEHISLILKGFDFCPTGEGIDVGNLCPYTLPMPEKYIADKPGSSVASNATSDMPYMLVLRKKAVGKKPPNGWEDRCKLLSYLPFWRSVLLVRWCQSKKFPSTKLKDQDKHLRQINENRRKSREEASSRIPNHNLGLWGGIPQPSMYQPRRLFGSPASMLLKVLKHA